MQTYKPVFKENDLKLYESVNKQFLDSFPDKKGLSPKSAIKTCDLHLTGKQPLLFVDPKGNGVNDISWLEPKDISEFWKAQESKLWGIIFVVSVFFFIIIYYFWGLPSV